MNNLDCQNLEKSKSTQLLEEAFQHFNQASQRLEAKYSLLLKETEKLRAQIEEKDREIRRAERLATLGETAAGIAHEIRNPLGAIKLFISLLRQDLAGQLEPLNLVNQIENSIVALDAVVANILQFARKDSLEQTPLNMHAIIKEQIEQFSSAECCCAVFNLDLQGNPFIRGNESGLRQVIYNLLLNALQATSYKGFINISCRDQPDSGLEMVVEDSGPGISEKVNGRIFDPFVSDKNEGTGLGLAIVKKILDQHKADIRVCNNPGAQFTVSLKRNSLAENIEKSRI